jgi:hypothetical protein
MLIYWLLFAYPAILALTAPAQVDPHGQRSAGQKLAAFGFVVFYTLLSALREEVGGDWINYIVIYDDIELDNLAYALTSTDPLYGLSNWISAQLGMGIYLVNGICGLALVWGVVSATSRLREPWLAIAMAVPYLLIVVGLGYVRQGAAIGMLLLAISAFERGQLLRTVFLLFMAVGFHSTAVMVFPLFAWAIARRQIFLAALFVVLIFGVYLIFVVPRIEQFDAGYIQAEYDSGGATTRVLMSAIPSMLLLLRWRQFGEQLRASSVWVSMGIASIVALAALAVSPSSTAVDRAALFFSPVQMVVFGEFQALANLSTRAPLMYRSALIALAAFVQVVWLVFATNAPFWVPYQSIFSAGSQF